MIEPGKKPPNRVSLALKRVDQSMELECTGASKTVISEENGLTYNRHVQFANRETYSHSRNSKVEWTYKDKQWYDLKAEVLEERHHLYLDVVGLMSLNYAEMKYMYFRLKQKCSLIWIRF